MNFQDEYLKKEQKNDICKKYCNKHKVIFFLCTYPVQISWGFTIFIVSLFTIAGLFLKYSISESIFATSIILIFLFVADGMGGTKELPWKVNIKDMIYQILSSNDIEKNLLKISFKLLGSFLYKAYANSIILAVILFISSLTMLFYLK